MNVIISQLFRREQKDPPTSIVQTCAPNQFAKSSNILPSVIQYQRRRYHPLASADLLTCPVDILMWSRLYSISQNVILMCRMLLFFLTYQLSILLQNTVIGIFFNKLIITINKFLFLNFDPVCSVQNFRLAHRKAAIQLSDDMSELVVH